MLTGRFGVFGVFVVFGWFGSFWPLARNPANANGSGNLTSRGLRACSKGLFEPPSEPTWSEKLLGHARSSFLEPP